MRKRRNILLSNTNDFILDIIARLNKQLSKRAINGDLRTLDNTMYVKVLAKLSKSLAASELKKQLKGLENLYVNVGIKADKGAKDKIQRNIQTLQQSIKDIEIGLEASKEQQRKLFAQIEGIRSNVQKRVNSEPLEFNLQLKKDKLISDIEYTGKRFSKLFSSDSATKKYESMMQRAMSVADKGQLSDSRAELAAFTSEMKASGLASKSMGDRWRDLTSRAKDLFSAASIVRVAFTQVKEAVSTTIDLDKAYTGLIKVQSELTRSDYPDYLDRCNRKAQELATTQKSLFEGAEEFSKSGYDLETSNGLTEKSTILSNVGEMSASDSAKAIISGVQAYDTIDGYTDVVDKAGALIDKYNELGNTASITTEELAKGVQSVGSVFADANTNVDQFLSLLSAGNRQYQNADSLALGLRTSALRIRGASVELEEAGEDIEGVMSTLDNQKAIKALTGVDILESDQKTIRSIYDIFLDISKVYKDMADVDQSALLDILAGKHRASAISATLNNMTEAETILQNSLNATGSAQREYDTYLESSEAHLQKFQSKLVETYSTFMNGDMVSHTADIGTAILNLVNKINLLKHSLLAVAAIKIGKGIATAGGAFSEAVTQINTLGNAIQKVRKLPLDKVMRKEALVQIGEETKKLTDKNLRLLLTQNQLNRSDSIRILRSRDLSKEQAKEKLETLGLTNATKANTAANTANTASVGKLKGAFTGLKASAQAAWAAMSTLEKASVILAVASTVWSIGSSVMSGFKQSLDDIRQKANELGDAFNSTKTEIEDYKTKIGELHAVINDSGSSLGDVTEARKTLMSVQDELIKKFGTEKDTIDLITAAVNGQTDAFDRLSQKQWQEVKNDFNDSGFGDDMLNMFDGYKSNIDRMLDEYGNYNVKVDLSYASGNYKSKEAQEIRELLEANGMEISYTMNGTGVPFVELSGTADEVYNKVLKIQELFSEDNPLSSGIFSDYLTGLANAAKDTSEQYKEMYDNYILYEEIFKNSSYKDSFKDITDAYEEYNDAFAMGDEKAIASAAENYASIMASATEDALANGDADVSDYFDRIYPEMQSVMEQWEFKTKILPDLDMSGLEGKTENEILEMLQTDGIQEGEESFNSLIDKAVEYGACTDKSAGEVQKLIDLLIELGYVQDSITEGSMQGKPFSDRFQSLWNSEGFSSAQESLMKLSREAGITSKDILSLARENSELSTLLDESGISAQFAATCFQRVCDGADGFSAITDDARALDQVLHEMDGSLQMATASKSAYDKAMSQDDYNAEFKNYQDAYKSAMEMFENGEYGKHFRSAMEYLLGDESYTMSIEELKNSMDGLKNVFGEDSTNGLEFLDKLYEKKDILDGMDSSLEKLSDGSYKFDLKPDEFEKIGDALGMTKEEIAACTNALGMFGNYAYYDIGKLEDTLKGMSVAAKDGKDSLLSLQGVESMLSNLGYNGYEIYHIMQDIQGMDGIKLIDFSADDENSLDSIVSQLKELDMIEINGDSINVESLIDNLRNSFNMASEDISSFITDLNRNFDFEDAEGKALSLNGAIEKVQTSENDETAESIHEVGTELDDATDKAQEFNSQKTTSIQGEFVNLKNRIFAVTQEIITAMGKIDELNNKKLPDITGSAGGSGGVGNIVKGAVKKVIKGKAKASGTIGVKSDETALVNELGNETIIDPKSGTYEVVEGGAQFRKLKKGQIVLNHLQTKALLAKGKIDSFGQMMFGGNASLKGKSYAEGTAGGINPATGKSYKKKNGKNSDKKDSGKKKEETEKEFEEVFDWIERRIKKFQRSFDKWIKQAETAVTSNFINKYYKKAASSAKSQMSTYGKAYNRYMREANAVGLDEKYAKKVRNGTIDIEEIRAKGTEEEVKKYEELAERIKEYQDWYSNYALLSGNRQENSI